jgi:hypothetical protein
MSVNSRCWELKGAGAPPVLAECTVGRPSPDEVLIRIDGCTWSCTNLSYSYAGAHTESQPPPKLNCQVYGHVIEAGADALYFTDRAVIVPVVVQDGDAAPWFTSFHPTRGTPDNEIDDGDCMIVPARQLRLIEQGGSTFPEPSSAFLPLAM